MEEILFIANLLIFLAFNFAMNDTPNVFRLLISFELVTFSASVLCTSSTILFQNSWGLIAACLLLVCAAAESAVLLALILRHYKKTDSILLNTYKELRG